MERDELIIWVYLWVCDQMQVFHRELEQQHLRLRRAGFAPALTDEEVLTMELCGEMLRLSSDKAIYSHFKTHYQSWFPQLRDRPAFVRQGANLWRVKLWMEKRLLHAQDVQNQKLQPLDTMPLPVCAKATARQDRCFPGLAHKGFCAAKDLFYYGFKLGFRITMSGFISFYALLQANTHDCRHLVTMVEGVQGVVPVDKGFYDSSLWKRLFLQGVHMMGRGPKHIDRLRPPELRMSEFFEKWCAKARKQVEVVAALLCSRFHIDRIRVHDLWHFENRLLRKILAFNLLVTINRDLHRPPLDFDGLVLD